MIYAVRQMLVALILSLLFIIEAQAGDIFSDVALNSTSIPRYEKLEATFAVQLDVHNPYNPNEISVLATIRTPSGRHVTVPAFYFQDYSRRPKEGGGEELTAAMASWKVRYAPTERGEHTLTLEVYTAEIQHQSRAYGFHCTKGTQAGFARAASNQAFECDDGSAFFPVGLNTCWGNSTYDFERWFEQLAKNGGNFGRLWLSEMFLFGLERKDELGRINSEAAWRLDTVLSLAEKHGIRLMFCIESFNSLRIEPDYQRWNENPYNAANGGPCEKPKDFFTSAAARELFKRRLRTIVARWGYSPNVFCWEMWNEVDLVDAYDSVPVRQWHVEMARYLRRIDPNRHLISTSVANSQGDLLLDSLPEMDFVQTHNYGAQDLAAELSGWCVEKAKRYKKPHVVGEFGLHWQGTGNEHDKEGAHLREALWATALSRSAGAGLTWWWDTYVEPNQLWNVFKPLADFSADIAWNKRKFSSIQPRISYASPQPPQRYDIKLGGRQTSWEEHPSNRPQRVTVRRDGTIEGAENLSGALHGKGNHPTWQNPVTFVLEDGAAWSFAVNVKGVSDYGGANLKIFVDGVAAMEKNFIDADEKRTGTMEFYDGQYVMPVLGGAREIRVLNDGIDWLNCSYSFYDYRLRFDPPVRAFGVQDGTLALVYLQNERASFRALSDGATPRVVEQAVLSLAGMRDGFYRVEFWDTVKGLQTVSEARAGDGVLRVSLPAILKDMAVKARWVGR